MQIEFQLHTEPPLPEVLVPARKRQKKLLLVVLPVLIATVLSGIIAYARFWGNYPDGQSALEYSLMGLGFLAAVLAWKLVKTIFGFIRLSEVHPVSAQAYWESASSEAVKSYCGKVMQQGRNLTMGETDMLLKHCRTQEEITRLSAYYEEHAPMTNYGRCG